MCSRGAVQTAILVIAAAAPLRADERVPQWSRWEREFTAQSDAGDFVEFSVALTSPGGKAHHVAGFWDGGRAWRVRFLPGEPGLWKYRTRAQPVVAGLDGQAGEFECVAAGSSAPAFQRQGPVRVAAQGTFLAHADGTPFFWLGDTVWCGPALATQDDWRTYLHDRLEKRFSVIQFNAVCPWRCAAADRDGNSAYLGRDPIRINPRYFQRLDGYYDAIHECGLVAAPVLAWAHKTGDAGMDLGEEDVVKLVRYQVARYGAHHVVWILAGDNSYKPEQAQRWKRIGRAVFGSGPHAPVTTHPTGMNWPWDAWREETWLDVLGYQSGHGDDARTLAWIHSGPVSRAWASPPVRPIINLEPPYEDHLGYQSRKPHTDSSVRRAVYWSLLSAPPAGVTYGGHGIWSWQTAEGQPPVDHPSTGVARPWRAALNLPAAAQMGHLAALFAEIGWWELRPAPQILASQPGEKDPAQFVAAAQSGGRSLTMVYLPAGGKVQFRPATLPAQRRAEWFDPRTGKWAPATITESLEVPAPDRGDWVLVIRDPSSAKGPG